MKTYWTGEEKQPSRTIIPCFSNFGCNGSSVHQSMDPTIYGHIVYYGYATLWKYFSVALNPSDDIELSDACVLSADVITDVLATERLWK